MGWAFIDNRTAKLDLCNDLAAAERSGQGVTPTLAAQIDWFTSIVDTGDNVTFAKQLALLFRASGNQAHRAQRLVAAVPDYTPRLWFSIAIFPVVLVVQIVLGLLRLGGLRR